MVLIELFCLLLTVLKLKGEWAEARGDRFDFVGTLLYISSLFFLIYGTLNQKEGGIYLVYETDFPALIKELARNQEDSALNDLLKVCREEMNVSTEPFLTILTAKCAELNIPLNRYWGDRGDDDDIPTG